MRENSTKPSNVQQTKAINTANDLRDSVDAATRFINRFVIRRPIITTDDSFTSN